MGGIHPAEEGKEGVHSLIPNAKKKKQKKKTQSTPNSAQKVILKNNIIFYFKMNKTSGQEENVPSQPKFTSWFSLLQRKYDFILYFRSGPIPLIPTSKSHTYML